MKTKLRRDLIRDIRFKQSQQPIGLMPTKKIVLFLVRRHSDSIVCAVLALAFGVIIGLKV